VPGGPGGGGGAGPGGRKGPQPAILKSFPAP